MCNHLSQFCSFEVWVFFFFLDSESRVFPGLNILAHNTAYCSAVFVEESPLADNKVYPGEVNLLA